MARAAHSTVLTCLGALTLIAAAAGGCASRPATAAMSDVPPPVDDTGKPMGPMPLAVSDRLGRQLYMSRTALVARGVVPAQASFADGSMSTDNTGGE